MGLSYFQLKTVSDEVWEGSTCTTTSNTSGMPEMILFSTVSAIAWPSRTLIWPSVSELVDAGAPREIQKQISEIACNTRGVREVHAIRSRYISSSIQIDLHIVVDGNIRVREGHTIADSVEDNIICGIPEILDVVVHVDASQASSDNQFSVENN